MSFQTYLTARVLTSTIGNMPQQPPPLAPSRPKPKPVRGHDNPFEIITDQAREAGKNFSETPKQIAQEAVDQMWAALLGADVRSPLEKPREDPAKQKRQERKNQDTFTKLNLEKLNAAYTRQDYYAIKQINQRLQEHQQRKQILQASHQAYRAELERAAQQRKQEEEERKKRQLEEEQMKKRQEEEEAAARAQMADAGAGKKKVGIGQARPKAQVETNFEAGKGRAGR